MSATGVGAAAAIAIVFASAAAHAEAQPPVPTSPKRAVPDYDGTGQAPEAPGGPAVWAPRIVLLPLYLVQEYMARRPLGAIVSWAERDEIPRKVYDFFTYEEPSHQLGFAPVGFLEFGFAPSIGLYAFAKDALVVGHSMRVHVETWPVGSSVDWLAGSFTDTLKLDPDHVLTVRVASMKRPDMMFYGVGPSTLQSNLSRYAIDKVDAKAQAQATVGSSSSLTATAGVRKVSTHDGHLYGDPSLTQEARTGAFDVPNGFLRTELAPYGRVDAVLDTRARGDHGTGLRTELHGEALRDVAHATSWSALRYGAAVSGVWDVNHHGRVLGLTVATLFADPLTRDALPFTELVSLGGDNPMPGYFAGRLLDRSATVATLQYDWPIAPYLAGTLQASTGNVFGLHLSEMRPGLLRVGLAMGLATKGILDPPVELLVGAGSETADHGLQIDTVRLAVGVPHSF